MPFETGTGAIERALASTAPGGHLELGFYHSCFELSVIVSSSMAPALQGDSEENGDLVLAERISYRFRDPRRWEIIHTSSSDGMPIMKRVVGLPGEQLRIVKNRIEIDGQTIERPGGHLQDLYYYSYGNVIGGRTVDCGDGYYALGDDSKDSQDSRFEGPFPPGSVRGRAWLILWPPSRMGLVK